MSASTTRETAPDAITDSAPERHAGDMDLTHGSTIVSPAVTTAPPQTTLRQDLAVNRSHLMSKDLQTALKGLGLYGKAEVFWLTTEPKIADEALDLRTACL